MFNLYTIILTRLLCHQKLPMRNLLPLFFVLLINFSFSQIECHLVKDSTRNKSHQSSRSGSNTTYGEVHTPKGELRVLFIFVGYEGVDTIVSSNKKRILNPNWLTWHKDSIPRFAKGNINGLFNADPNTITHPNVKHNLSELYYLMSNGKFKITADIYPELVKIPFLGNYKQWDPFTADTMNQSAIEWIAQNDPSFDWSKYDKRTNYPDFKYDNTHSVPDSILDYVVFMHRKSGTFTGASGFASTRFNSRYMSIPGTHYIIEDGHYGIQTNTKVVDHLDYFTHEFAHNLWDSPHAMGANSVNGAFYTTSFGWGLMSNTIARFKTANAWERWYNGWIKPDSIVSNQQVVLHDFSSDDFSKSKAIQIPIPGSNGQFLWLENHQKKSFWDEKSAYGDTSKGEPMIEEGIYGYITHERINDLSDPIDNTGANHIRLLEAGGNNDFYLLDTCASLINGSSLCFDVLDRDSAKSNPFGGKCSFQNLPFDTDGNGSIRFSDEPNSFRGSTTATERGGVWVERINGVTQATYDFTGNEDAAFNVGDEIGLSGIMPVMNYKYYDKFNQKYRKPQVLNGVSVKIISYDQSTGAYTLDIKFDDYSIRKDSRWCGDIAMPLIHNGSVTLDFVLEENLNLDIDLSGTPDRIRIHPVTNTFANPTKLKLETGASFLIKKNANVNVKQHSILELMGYSKIIVEDGATLRIGKTSKFILNSNAKLIVKGSGKIIVEEGAYFHYGEGTQIELQDNNSVLEINGGWALARNADFTFTGNGYLKIGTGIGQYIKLDGNNSFTLKGRSHYDKVLEIADSSFIDRRGNYFKKFSIINGKVILGDYAGIINNGVEEIYYKNVHVTTDDPSTLSFGIAIVDLDYHEIDHLTLMYSKYGLSVYHYPGDSILRINNSTFYLNEYGVRNIWGGVNLSSCNVVDNTYGMYLFGVNSPSLTTNSNYNENNFGIYINGGNTNFSFNKSKANKNSIGVYAFGDVTFQAKCGEVRQNNVYGFSINTNAILDLSDYSKNKPSQLDASGNFITAYFNDAGDLRLDKGYNLLVPGGSGPTLFTGSLRQNCGTITGSNNLWNLSGTAPVSSVDYNLRSSISNCPIYVNAPNTLRRPYDCGKTPLETGKTSGTPIGSLGGSKGILFKCSNCNGSLASIKDKAFEIPSDIKLNISSEAQNNSDYIPEISYENLKRVATHMLTVNKNSTLTDELVDALKPNLETFPEYDQSIYATDLAMLQYAKGDFNKAITTLESIEHINDIDLDLREQYKCEMENFSLHYSNSLNAIELFESVNQCGVEKQSSERVNNASKPGLAIKNEILEIKKYPNPFNNELNIEINLFQEEIISFEIKNAMGKTVSEIIQSRQLDAGKHLFTLNSNTWAKGIYFIYVTNKNSTVSQMVKVVKM